LDLVAILKGAKPCYTGQTCLDLEISGKVLVAADPQRPDVRFDGRIWGRLLFNLERGDVVWSETRSQEEMVVGKERMEITSCLHSRLQGPNSKPNKLDGFKCEPSAQAVNPPAF
jgi:hypothetical protein